jgi:hypothetical protein
LVAGSALALGCSDAAPPPPDVGDQQAPIINGSVDNSGQYEDVVAVFGAMSKCTGTIVAKQEPYAFVLTAAHCVNNGAPQVVVQGVNHDNPTATYNVQDYAIHPGYNGSVNDFAMIRVTGAGPSTPVRAVLTAGEDNLGFGSQVTHLGYGNIGANPEVSTNQRHITTGQVIGTTNLTLTFDASSSGVCFGDSGGPNIDNTTGKVAGVNSSVSTSSCNGESYSGRASAVLSTFIQPFINNAPPPPVDCDGCFEAATTGNGACISSVNACFGNSACSALVDCFNNCSTQTCINQCAQTHSGGVSLYNAIFDCVCDTACMTECENDSMCTSPDPPPATSSSVAQSSVAADAAATSSTSGVGGATGAGGAGVGGSAQSTGTGTDGNYYAGDADDEDPDGVLVTSCTFDSGNIDSGRHSGGWAWLVLGAGLGAALIRRRRRDR